MSATTLSATTVAVPTAATPAEHIDAMLEDLRSAQPRLEAMGPGARAELARALIASVATAGGAWTAAGAACKAIPADSPWAAEEIVLGPLLVLRALQLMAQALEDTEEQGAPELPGAAALDPRGRVRVPVFPSELMYDSAVFAGFTGSAIMQAGVGLEDVGARQAGHFRLGRPGGVTLVLGAGNLTSIGPTDALEKLFLVGHCVLLKLHPNFAGMAEVFDEALRPVIEAGLLRICQGGAETGAYAAHHPGVNDVHITGSDRAWDALVWGEGQEASRRRAAGTPLLRKLITGELGNVTPWIVVPSRWSDEELRHQAEHLVGSLICNTGFNCVAPRVVVTWRGWSQRERFLEAVQEFLDLVPARYAWYPGASERYEEYTGLAAREDRHLPWAFLRDLDPAAKPHAVSRECFVGAFAEVALDAPGERHFVERAADFANDGIAGNLGVSLIVHPEARADTDFGGAVERAVADLRYGTVAVNQWSGLSYVLKALPWGGYPTGTLGAPASGLGWAHNPYMLDGIEKSLFEGPFLVEPKPVTFPTNRNAGGILRALLELTGRPEPENVERLVAEVGLA